MTYWYAFISLLYNLNAAVDRIREPLRFWVMLSAMWLGVMALGFEPGAIPFFSMLYLIVLPVSRVLYIGGHLNNLGRKL